MKVWLLSCLTCFIQQPVDLVIQERILTIIKLFYLGIDIIIYLNVAVVIIVTNDLTQVFFFKSPWEKY